MDVEATESVEEAAERLGLSVEAVRKRARRGTLPATKVGGRLRILKPVERTRPAQAVPSHQPDMREAEVAYLRDELRRARDEVAAERRQRDTDLAAERERHEAAMAEKERAKDAQLAQILSDFRAAVAQLVQRQLPAPQDEQPTVIDLPPKRRPWWRRW